MVRISWTDSDCSKRRVLRVFVGFFACFVRVLQLGSLLISLLFEAIVRIWFGVFESLLPSFHILVNKKKY